MNKKAIRERMLDLRLNLSAEAVAAASKKITDKLESLSAFRSAGTVLFYSPFRNEVDITGLIEKSFAEKTVCLPRIEKGAGQMTARKVLSLKDLATGEYGIFAPLESAQLIGTEKIDFVVVPLVAFDEKLHRIGYGGGYYDRYLPKCTNAFKCGAAYAFQKTDKIISAFHDIMLDMIVTEV